jgi:hypothetical protein
MRALAQATLVLALGVGVGLAFHTMGY